mgnify:CR=1 FL=1
MDKLQQKLLVAAWRKQQKILREIRDLASTNVVLAYGLIRTAETMIDMIMVDNVRKVKEKEERVKPNIPDSKP